LVKDLERTLAVLGFIFYKKKGGQSLSRLHFNYLWFLSQFGV